MAKSSKKSKEATTQEANLIARATEPSNGVGSVEPAQLAAIKKAAKSTGRAKSSEKKRAVTPRKAAASRKPRAKTGAQSTAAGTGPGEARMTNEEIRIRAYFISEWRMKNGIAGDSTHDWLEARRQLQDEAAKRN